MKTTQFWLKISKVGAFLRKILRIAFTILVFTTLFIVTLALGSALVFVVVAAFTMGAVFYVVVVVLRYFVILLADAWVASTIIYKRLTQL